MYKNSILPKKSGSPTNQKVLTDRQSLEYFNWVADINSNQNWRSEKTKMHSRILRGFFYARKMCNTMMDCVGKSLVSALGLPFSFVNGNANPARSVTSQLALKVTVSNLTKETANV